VSRILILLPCLAAPAFAHGGEPPPPPEEPEDPPPPDPPVPPPPPPMPPPAPPHETTPPESGKERPTLPGRGRRPLDPRRPTVGRRNKSAGLSTSWRLFWNYNRENLIGLRGRVRGAATTTGSGETWDTPLGPRRDEVRGVLRSIAVHDPKTDVRAAAMIALGRMGGRDDARTFVRVLHGAGNKQALKEAAAVALAILPPLEDDDVKKEVREYLSHVIRHDRTLPARVRGLCLLASGMRAGGDPVLLLQLTGRASGEMNGGEEAGTLAYALGLSGHPMAAPELARAAKRRKLGGEKLTDIGRALAAQGLAYVGDAAARRSLEALLTSRRAGVHTRRSAALGFGRILTTRRLDQEALESTREALERAIDKDNDLLVKGFSAAALGAVRRSAAREFLEERLGEGARAELKPYLALGLGIWGQRAGEASRRRVREVLAEALSGAREPEFRSALCIACGLAKASGARDAMRKILADSGNAAVRGAAAQGLGLLGEPDPDVIEALEDVLEAGEQSELLPDAALALGLMGRRAAAGELARGLRETTSSVVQGRIILALGHLGHREAIDPLLKIVRSGDESTLVREFAAVALGLMGDAREKDPLFTIDAWFNYYATTRATNELLRLY